MSTNTDAQGYPGQCFLYGKILKIPLDFPADPGVKNPPAKAETWV